jgi:hypothetical protein
VMKAAITATVSATAKIATAVRRLFRSLFMTSLPCRERSAVMFLFDECGLRLAVSPFLIIGRHPPVSRDFAFFELACKTASVPGI